MTKIGEDTHSAKSSNITSSIFFLQFFNTGLLSLLVTANFKEQGLESNFFNGHRTDFGMLWYS